MTLAWVDRMAVDVAGPATGGGDAVVCLHGLGGTMNTWTPLLPALTRWRCVRPELPGAGRSRQAHALGEATPHGGRLSAEVHAQAVLRACDALGVARAHLVGHSFGTLIALHVAAQQPARVASLALFGALLEPAPAARQALRERAARAREQGLIEIAEATAAAALSASSRESQPLAEAFVRESIAAQCAEGYARNCLALSEVQPPPLAAVRAPVLIVNGDEDAVAPLSGARLLAERLPAPGGRGARVHALARCGHWPTVERPLECRRLLGEFLDGVR